MNFQLFSDSIDWLSEIWWGIGQRSPSERSRAEFTTFVVRRNGYSPVGETSARADESLSLAELQSLLVGLDRQTQIHLRLSPDRYLIRPLSKKRLPFGRAHAMASIDIAESLPFLQDDSHVLFPESQVQSGTSYVVVHRSILDPVIAAITEVGLSVATISFDTGEGHEFASRASVRSVCAAPKGASFRRRLLSGLIGAAVVLSVATFAHAYIRNASAMAQLMEVVQIKQAQAITVRKSLERRSQELELSRIARASKAQTIPVALIWEELTRLLPDSTWLTDMSIKDGQIWISGFSTSAADLIAILATSPLLSDPSFASQVVRVPGQQGERFSIRMEMAQQ